MDSDLIVAAYHRVIEHRAHHWHICGDTCSKPCRAEWKRLVRRLNRLSPGFFPLGVKL
jgi:hypothetical protein